MKIINIDAAHPFSKEEIPTIRISIRRRSQPKTLEQAEKRNREQAQELYDALYDSLPAGTLKVFRELIVRDKVREL